MQVVAVSRSDVPAIEMPSRFRTDISYFMTPAGEKGAPKLGPAEYWIDREDAKRWLDDLVIEIVSPLSAEIKAEVEISEDQERWLEWLIKYEVQHVRLDTA
ncbi:MAG: hypothetical protein P8N76_01345 [Pirellulaceae bacterium]|nr:hypothetical protein [Planctomycetaceae bacterium]MDG2380295.1 hypothetical protein [Pirellulaceae bacterium]